MIRLLLLIPTLDRSGAEKQFTLLATGLPRAEFDVHAVALTRGGPYADALRGHGIPLTVLGKRFKLDPAALWRLKRLVASLQPDILHSWLFTANAYGRLVAGRAARPRVIVSERCVDVWKSGWQLWLDRRQMPRTARLVGNSQGVADFYLRHGVSPQAITVIPNGVEIPSADRSGRDAFLGEFQLPPDARVVGYAGRLAPQKRVHDLVWAMQLLHQLTERVYFLIIGEGPERQRLARLARHFGSDHLMRFVGHREDSARLIAHLDVFWLASEFEGMSNSLMEAMAAGVPAVASDIPPNRELIADGETGRLVPVGDSAAFAKAAAGLLEDADEARRLGDAARRRMQAAFSIDKMVSAHAELYREVMEVRNE